MTRIRFVFEKRNFACFVRHVELPQLFGRVARRGGLRVDLTQGMSPHPHIVMGPALPVGVVSLYELAEIWFAGDVAPEEALEKMNFYSPSGFRFLKAAEIASESRSLNKCYDAASYWLCPRDVQKINVVAETIRSEFGGSILLGMKRCDDGLELATHDPSQTGPGALVKALMAHEVISGWPDVCIARLCLGRWDAERNAVEPLL